VATPTQTPTELRTNREQKRELRLALARAIAAVSPEAASAVEALKTKGSLFAYIELALKYGAAPIGI
jgi:hypothetical protein